MKIKWLHPHSTNSNISLTKPQQKQSKLNELNANQETLMQRVSEKENRSVVGEELHRQANYLRTLESTNAKLNLVLTVLREQKRGLEKRVQVLEELRT